MNIKIDVHKNNQVERKLNSLSKWKVPETTKKEIREFVKKARIGQVNQGKRLSERTISKYLTLLKTSLEIINKPTPKITKEDIERYDKLLSNKNFKSVSDYRVNIRIFLKWKIGEEKTNKIAGWLDTRQKKKTPDYLSEQEIEKLYKNCKNSAERFLIAVLFDSGARAEEFLNIRYEDIQMPDKNETYVKLTLKEEYSKTKGRVISLYWKYSLEAIKDYLNERIQEGIKSNEPVFNKNYDATRMFLSRLGKKILHKDIYPHLFRHSSCTYYATKLNRQEFCYRYGWAFSSEMPDVYISRSGMESKQLDEKFKSTELEELKRDLEKIKQKEDINSKRYEESDKHFGKLLKFFEKHPELANKMIKKDKEAVIELFN